LKMSPDKKEEGEIEISTEKVDDRNKTFKPVILWVNVVKWGIFHILAVYGCYLMVTRAQWKTWLWIFFLHNAGGLGVTAGAHRLWSHRTYKAKWPLKFLLVLMDSLSGQSSVIHWARDHRGHHKWSETSADPHDATRGFFFSHIGWLMEQKHPDVIRKGKTLDISDLYGDPLLKLQDKYYIPFMLTLCFLIPTVVPYYYWNESLLVAFLTAAIFRYCVTLHATWCVNSIAHMFGFRPYDKNINPAQNYLTTIIACGEGWHNFHHVFPSDYRASEFPYLINMTTVFIDFFALIGWAYDRKAIDQTTINKRKEKAADRSDG